MNTNTIHRSAAVLLIVEGLLLFVPVFILGAAINWPASLDEPASVVLPQLVAQESAVRVGYLVYLIYSILFWPVAFMTVRVLSGNTQENPLLRLAVGFGIASAVARTLGIIRWLVPMPVLAAQYVDPATSAQTRDTIALIYQMLNDYAGSVGEVLGVSFFAALWLALVAVVILRTGALPRWLGVFGLISAAFLFTALLELFGVDLGPLLTVSTATIQLWMMAAGITLLMRSRSTASLRTASALS
ncbi:MAG: DUF4386 domain-containing protein [bacterium]|nr:DUF4386 domain-containing protein [bacterium]